MREIDKQIIQQLRHGPIQSTSIVKRDIEADIEYGELLNLLDNMVEEGKIEYRHGEYGEYTLPDDQVFSYDDPSK